MSMVNSKAPARDHIGFPSLFAPARLTLGVFFPIEVFQRGEPMMRDQERLARRAEELGFSALWFRDVPCARRTSATSGKSMTHGSISVGLRRRHARFRLPPVQLFFPCATRCIPPKQQRLWTGSRAAGSCSASFWEMHDQLFEHQQALNDEDLIGYAEELGLNMVRFGQDMTEHRYAARIREDILSGVRSGVNGTPTFFINGMRHEGFYDVDFLSSAITEAVGVIQR